MPCLFPFLRGLSDHPQGSPSDILPLHRSSNWGLHWRSTSSPCPRCAQCLLLLYISSFLSWHPVTEVNVDLNKSMGLFNRPDRNSLQLNVFSTPILSTADSAENDDVIVLLLLSARHPGWFSLNVNFPRKGATYHRILSPAQGPTWKMFKEVSRTEKLIFVVTVIFSFIYSFSSVVVVHIRISPWLSP